MLLIYHWAPIAANKTIVIDNSKFFRKDLDIPLIVPEVNSFKSYQNLKIKTLLLTQIAVIIPIVVIKPLHDLYNVKRIVASTYQSVSGVGKAGMDELLSQTKEILKILKSSSIKKFYKNKLHSMQFHTSIKNGKLNRSKKIMMR